jgi:hypothetical protein
MGLEAFIVGLVIHSSLVPQIKACKFQAQLMEVGIRKLLEHHVAASFEQK